MLAACLIESKEQDLVSIVGAVFTSGYASRNGGDDEILLVSERSSPIPCTAVPPYIKAPRAPSNWDFHSNNMISENFRVCIENGKFY